MSVDRGWVKLWRRSLDSEVFQNDGLWKVWTWCLMRASHKEQHLPVKTGRGTTTVTLKPGQFLYGRNSAARELGMAPSTLRNRIARLKKLGNLDIKEDKHFSVISIVNWSIYQAGSESEDSQQDNQRTTKGHIQECKELKKPLGRAYKPFKEDV